MNHPITCSQCIASERAMLGVQGPLHHQSAPESLNISYILTIIEFTIMTNLSWQFSLQELSWSCKDSLHCFYSDLRIPLSPPPPSSSHKYFGYSSLPFASGILRWPVESLHQTGNLGRGNFVPRVLSYSSLPSRRGPLGTRAMGKRISSAQEARTEREEEERTITNPKSVGEMENSLFQQPLGLDSRNAPRACLFRQ